LSPGNLHGSFTVAAQGHYALYRIDRYASEHRDYRRTPYSVKCRLHVIEAMTVR